MPCSWQGDRSSERLTARALSKLRFMDDTYNRQRVPLLYAKSDVDTGGSLRLYCGILRP